VYLPDIELHEAKSIDEATSLLERFGPDARVLAGGTDLLVDLKIGRKNVSHVVSISGVGDLRGIRVADGGLRIGATTTLAELAASPRLDGPFVVLRDATSRMAAPQIRNMATIGGNVSGGVPCADVPPALSVLDSVLAIQSSGQSRQVRVDEFFLGPRETLLGAGEMLTEICIPAPPPGFGSGYARFGLRNGNAIAVAGVAASLVLDGDGCVEQARLCLSAVAPIPKPALAAAQRLVGRPPDNEALAAAATAAMEAAEPIGDVRGSAEYRRELVGVLTQRAIRLAAERARASEEASS
jgi:carbon-monoxide dehydrogenase medium subunit